MKPNHHSLAYKQQKQPNKTYKELKQKQKMKITDWMFRATCDYYKEHEEMPTEEAAVKIVDGIYTKIKSQAIWVPYEEVSKKYVSNLERYEKRILEQGIPEEKPKKEKSEPKAKPKKKRLKCPECGRGMTQQFIGLKHCKCGISWKKDIGFFERSSDMIFCLRRRTVGKKRKQVPVIRYKEE